MPSFDTLSHYWMQRCLEERVSDPNLLWLVRKILKAGVIEEGQYHSSKEGTMQGGLCKALHNPPYAKKIIMQSKGLYPLQIKD